MRTPVLAFTLVALSCAANLCVGAIADEPSPVSTPTCSQPNREATVTRAAQPTLPESAALDVSSTTVEIRVTIDPAGHVAQATVYRSSRNDMLDESARAAALRSTYAPKLVNCVAVVGEYVFRTDFRPVYTPAVTSDTPAGSQWNNPFCDASAILVWDATASAGSNETKNAYVLYVWSNATSDYVARVTLIGGGSAYAVDLPRVSQHGGGAIEARSYRVTLPDIASVDHYFVDAVGVNGAALADCPSYVKPVARMSDVTDSLPAVSASTTIQARLVQMLGAYSCDVPFRALTEKKGNAPLVGFFGNRELSADVEVFVDSSGRVVKARIWRSSGVDGIDDAALSAAEFTTYEPAEFLCTPVVSSTILTVTYKPD